MRTLLLTIVGIMAGTQIAYTRGQAPPPPPSYGGNAGDWLGSGPIFGFDTPNGPGFNNPPPGGGGSGGGWNGGWGGDNGGTGSGGHIWGHKSTIDSMLGTTDSTGIPHSPFMGSCGLETATGCVANCHCNFTWTPGEYEPGQPVNGWCTLVGYRPFDVALGCSNVGENCKTTYRFDH